MVLVLRASVSLWWDGGLRQASHVRLTDRDEAPKEPPPLAVWATIDQAAQHVGVSRRIIQRWIVERGAQAAQLGGTTLIDLHLLDEWLKEEALRANKTPRRRALVSTALNQGDRWAVDCDRNVTTQRLGGGGLLRRSTSAATMVLPIQKPRAGRFKGSVQQGHRSSGGGRGFLSLLAGGGRNLRPSSIYTADRTPPADTVRTLKVASPP
jgi:excisionase family DNA binding protein